jgi:hypothetical protein
MINPEFEDVEKSILVLSHLLSLHLPVGVVENQNHCQDNQILGSDLNLGVYEYQMCSQ